MPPSQIWGLQPENQTVVWWLGSGASIAPDFLPIPDPNAWYIGDLGGPHTSDTVWPGGGSDGRSNYFAVIGADGQWYVDKFDAQITTLLDRFPIDAWSSWGIFDGSDYYIEQSPEVKHLSASKHRIVTIGQQHDGAATNSEYSVRVAVLDTAGALLHSHEIQTFPSNTWERLDDPSSSCIDAGVTKVYFAVRDWNTANTFIANADLETGADTTMFSLDSVNVAIGTGDATWYNPNLYPARTTGDFGAVNSAFGLLATPDGDLIIASAPPFAGAVAPGGGLVRVRPDGTPLWWHHLPTEVVPGLYDGWWGLAPSGNGSSFWACRTEASSLADEYTWDGTYIQTIQLPYPGRHAWLFAGGIPPLRQRQRDDVALPIGGRVALGTGNISTSRQASIRQGSRNTYY